MFGEYTYMGLFATQEPSIRHRLPGIPPFNIRCKAAP